MEGNSSSKIAVFSVDVEDWYHLEYFKGKNVNRRETCVQEGLVAVRNLLKRNEISASFFVVAELIDSILSSLLALKNDGHEIGLHSFRHIRPLTQSNLDFEDDIKDSLEKFAKISKEIPGYRAPCFSLDRERLNLLISNKFKYDSSKIDQDQHPLYSDLDISDFVKTRSKGIYKKGDFYEFENQTQSLLGFKFPISGGGYIRILPWFFYRFLVLKYIRKNSFFSIYIHPFELTEKQIELPIGTSLLTRFRFSYNRRKVIGRLQKLIDLLRSEGYEFTSYDKLLKT